MAVFKCKMCGGDLPNIAEGNVVECEYCGSRQTIPTADNEKKVTLFARANRLRFGCEFDKAAGVYESIVAEFPTEAEAYWGLVLCKYGIEYVDDPATGKKIPTCHRSSFDSVMEDDNFDQACENADAVARKVYRDEAKQIEELRKRIIEVSGKEEPYDIFICYKETDENGSRTLDSVLAQDIYNALTEKGYRVFFARISLEDKLGQEYEPYIFAALNSAKVMLAVGTDYEYYNAVWVKNEWSRYLALIAAGQKKTLIPCYKNIDAYDMPKEFARLQAQDMGKVGAMQDLLRGIEKIIGGKQEESKPQSAGVDVAQIVQQVMKQNVSVGGESNAAALLKRGYMALSDGDWEKANEFFDRVLDGDAENAEAYMGKFLAKEKKNNMESWAEIFVKQKFQPATRTLDLTDEQRRHITVTEQQNTVQGYLNSTEISQLYPKEQTYASNVNDEKNNLNWMRKKCGDKDFVRAMQFAQGEVKTRYDAAMAALNAKLNQRLEDAQAQEAQNIREAQKKLDKAFDEADVKAAKMKESAVQKRDQELKRKYQDCCNRMNEAKSDSDYREVGQGFKALGDYKDSREKAQMCEQLAQKKRDQELESKYQDCCHRMSSAKSEFYYREVRHDFEALGDYKDSREKAQMCEQLAQKWLDEQAKKARRSRRNKMIARIAVAAIVVIAAIVNFIVIPGNQYNAAVEMEQNGQYDEAILAFKAAGYYSDAATKVKELQYQKGEAMLASGDYNGAITAYQAATGYRDALKRSYQIRYRDLHEGKIAAGSNHTVGLKADGTVVAVGYNRYGSCNVRGWTDIVSIAAGDDHTVGLKADGTVVAAGRNEKGQCKVSDWTDIVSIAAGGWHTVGLKADGTVVATGYKRRGQCNVRGWTDIVSIAAGGDHTVGLKTDGTVVAVGNNGNGERKVSDWTDIVSIAAGGFHTVGLKADGTVVAAGSNNNGRCDVSGWTDIVSIAAGGDHTVGLKADGTVVAVGDNSYRKCDVSDWTDIVSIAAGNGYTVGLKSDGTVIAVGSNLYEECDVSDWTNIGGSQTLQ